MRTIVVFDSVLDLPGPAPVAPGILPGDLPPALLPGDLPPAIPSFERPPAVTRDDEFVYFTFPLPSTGFDGSMAVPSAFVATVLDPETGEPVSEGRREVLGPGPISVPVPGLIPGESYRVRIAGEYPGLPGDDGGE